jgi:preprotein translocase subunit YajC
MTDSWTAPLVFFAQAAPAGDPAGGAGSFLSILAIYALPVMVLWYFMIGRPEKERRRKIQETLGNLKKNDRVVTAAGIYGTVVSVDNDKVVLRIDDDKGVKLTCLKSTVVSVESPAADKATEPAKSAG